jgi:hypothetical protein
MVRYALWGILAALAAGSLFLPSRPQATLDAPATRADLSAMTLTLSR